MFLIKKPTFNVGFLINEILKMTEIRKIHLPTINGNLVEVETSQSILFIGANGSGKTRLGAWLHNKQEYKSIIHRVSAQRVLRFPVSSELKSLESSEQAVLCR